MSNYGFNENEVVQTKVTLIDKDGFHKESDEVPNGEGSSINVLAEKFYISNVYYDVDPFVNCIFIINKIKHDPVKINNLNHIVSTCRVFVYTGDAIDDSNISVDWDSLSPLYNGGWEMPNNISLVEMYGYNGPSNFLVISEDNFIVHAPIKNNNYNGNADFLAFLKALNAGDPIHAIVSFSYAYFEPNGNGGFTTIDEGEDFVHIHTIMPDIDLSNI